MAEFVEFRAEEWVTELEQMERIHLFDSKEIKTIATKRKEFEYKIQRRTKFKEDYLKYIQFEIDLFRLIKARREKTGIKTKKAEIEHSQTHRIGNLFKKVIFRFQDDVKLWMSFFKFCQEVKFHSLVSQMLVRMLQIHTDKPELWVFACKWEFEECKSVENARQFLTRGLRYHPSSDVLYQELFKLELENIKKKEKEKEMKLKKNEEWAPDEAMTNILEGKVAEIVYESAVKAIEGVDFKVRLMDIVKQYKKMTKLRNKIIEDIIKCHMNEELAWDAIAKNELDGIICDLSQKTGEDIQMEVDEKMEEKQSQTLRERIQRCVNVYEEAVKKLNTTKMWSFYLDRMIDLNEDVSSLPVLKLKLLRNALEGALESGHMDEKYFLHYAEMLRKVGKKNKKLSEVLQKGTEQHPKSVPLWYTRLRFYLSRDQETTGMELFEQAVENIPDAVPLWKLVIKYLQLKSSPKVEEVFQQGIQQGGDLALALKHSYVEWVALAKGISDARKVFESTEMQFPPCLDLYNKMAELETAQPEVCLKSVRRCHELACSNFGKSNTSVWLDFIRFELKRGEPARVNQIHRRALKALDPQLVDDFIAEFNTFKTDL